MKTTIKTALALPLVLFSATSAIAQVASISPENFAQYGKDEAYWVATVKCNDGGERTIQRRTDGSEWCGKEIEGFCGGSKDVAAKKVCGAEYGSAFALAEEQSKAQSEAAAAAAAAEERAKRAERERAEQRRRAEQQRVAREKKAAAAAPLKKKISIEEQLIKIEQEKLDLRRQELELQRRAVEIQNLLDKKS